VLSFKDHIHLSEEKEKFNLGHAYEFILAAAMVSKFTDRYEDGGARELTPQSVNSIINEYFRGNRFWHVLEGDGIEDSVEFDGTGIPLYILNTIKSSNFRTQSAFSKMVNDAIQAVNGNSTLTKLMNTVLKNGKEDIILVKCGGTSGQMKTKSDIDVYVNNVENRSAGFSVKYGNVKQIGQFASSDVISSLSNGFNTFGMNISRLGSFANVKTEAGKLSGIYPNGRTDPLIEPDKKRMFSAVSILFSDVAKKFSTSWLSSPQNCQMLTDGLLFAARGTEKDVDIIKSGISFDQGTFDGIAKSLAKYAKMGKLSWNVLGGGNPTIVLRAENMNLFSIRLRYDADRVGSSETYKARFRLLVEIGKDLIKFSKL